jgi:hypothetical protein
MKSGEVMVARCSPELASHDSLCSGAIEGMNFLGTVPRATSNLPSWWAIHEKL